MPESFAVYSTPFSNPGDRRESGRFATYKEAVNSATESLINDFSRISLKGRFAGNLQAGSAGGLFDLWREQGSDIVIEPDPAPIKFSALEAARLLILQYTEDKSRPLCLKISCGDRLIFASGFASPPKTWSFYVKAPATYVGDMDLLRRATDYLYAGMSDKARLSDGSSYELLSFAVSEASDEEIARNPGASVMFVHENGTLVKSL